MHNEEKDRGFLPLSILAENIVYDLVHFLLASCVVGLAQNGLSLGFCHGGIGVEGVGVHSQGHAEANGDFVEIHNYAPFVYRTGDPFPTMYYAAADNILLSSGIIFCIYMLEELYSLFCLWYAINSFQEKQMEFSYDKKYAYTLFRPRQRTGVFFIYASSFYADIASCCCIIFVISIP